MIGFKKISCIAPALGMFLSGCGAEQIEFDTDLHLTKEKVAEEQPVAPVSGVPDLISSTAALPELSYEGQGEVFDVVVDNVSVRQVLNSIADQAQLNLDIDAGLDGLISINAYGQNLGQILERIRKQIPMRFERIGETLVVLSDDRYVKQYHLNFPDLERTYSSEVEGNIASEGSSSIGGSSITSDKSGSGSVWVDLEEALNEVLEGLDVARQEFEPGPPGSSTEDEDQRESLTLLTERSINRDELEYFVHVIPDVGLIIVYGDSEQQKIAGEIIGKVQETSRRQVLLQATVVEIALNSQYQQGIDWSVFNIGSDGPKLLQSASRSAGELFGLPGLSSIAAFTDLYEEAFGSPAELQARIDDIQTSVENHNEIDAADQGTNHGDRSTVLQTRLDTAYEDLENYNSRRDLAVRQFEETNNFAPPTSASGGFFNASFSIGDLDAAVSLLDQFGDTRVVSSPRISTLNGQAAILKVVTDQIYFSTTIEREREDGILTETIEVEEQTVPVGFVVNVYPQIGGDGTIILSMRPSVSRVVGFALQPTVGINNLVGSTGVPIISVKEIDTLMMLNDGQTAVMGGLIEDQLQDSDTGIQEQTSYQA